ncbi:MAG: UDP-N-acetylmuramate dehydrogenase [Candidatus Shapirobacteria bacterium]
MEVFQNHSLAPHTTIKIGGPADIFIIAHNTNEFIEALSKNNKIIILGNGSNVLISDSGIRGTVINNQANSIEYLPNNQIKVDSGVQLPLLISNTIAHSFSGLEEFAYIPSSIGGAIYGNIHGVNKNNFDRFITEIEVFDLDTKTPKHLLSNQLTWSYDTSEFKSKPNLVILSATLRLSPGDPDTSKQTITDIINKKIKTQSMNSLGSTFKNPEGDSAGRIIDQELHLRGFRIGDAQISPLHGNFILNLGHATATDYFNLIKKIQSEAKSKLDIVLEPEILFLGNFS